MTTTTLTKWGNGQGVRLPKPLTEQLGIHVGDHIEIKIDNGAITLTPQRTRYVTIPDYEAMFRDYKGEQPTEDGFAQPAGMEAL